nr:carboxypeptidase regulatory-like domain-containing protein [Leptolyngbyaceae cyanobacterium MAG.088]
MSLNNDTTGLGNSVFIDANANGIQDEGEFGAEGVIVKLLHPDGTAVLDDNGHPVTTTTDSQGAYAFMGIPAGDYKVQFVAPEGFTFTNANVGHDDSLDSD